MEIRFCDRCSESIPEVDFDQGKAVTVGGKHYHAACALTKSLSIGGPRAWLTFFLALAGVGMATWLLVKDATHVEKAPVTAEVQAAIDEGIGASEARVTSRIDASIEAAQAVMSDLAKKTGTTVRDDVRARIEQLKGRLEEGERVSADHLAAQRRRMDAIDKELQALGAFLTEVRKQADRLEAQRAATPVVAPPASIDPVPEEPTAAEQPTPPANGGTMGEDSAMDEEVERWIRRLKDPNENIRFTATLQLGLLKSLKAMEPLILALDKDRDYYVRLGAATALGDIQAVGAIPALIDALEDDDGLVRTAANDALQAITDQPFEFVPGMSRSARRKLQRRWKDWLKDNETRLRERLGQPKPV